MKKIWYYDHETIWSRGQKRSEWESEVWLSTDTGNGNRASNQIGFFSVTFLKHQKHVVPIIFCKITVVTLIEHLLWQKTLNDIKNNESAVCLHFSWLFTWFCLWYSFHSRYESPYLQHTSELGQPLELKLLSIWSLAPEQCSPKTSCSSKKLHLSFLWILLFLSKLTKMTPIIGPNMIQM